LASLSFPPSWEGDLVRIRPIEPEDAVVFAAHERDDAASRLGSGFVPIPWSAHRLREWAADTERSNSKNENFQFAIEQRAGGAFVGVLNTHNCVPRTGVFSYGVQVFPDHRRRGLAREAITLVLAYYFEERRYQKCNVTIYDYNQASVALHHGLGFHGEGRLRRTVFTAGSLHDELLFGITAEEFAATHRSARSGGAVALRGDIEFRRRPDIANDELARLFDANWDERSAQDHTRTLAHSLTWIGAYHDGRLVGFVNVAWDGGVHAFLLDTTVDHSYRHRGIGTGLVSEALAATADHPGIEWVHVDSSPELLAGFYAPAGFGPTAAGLFPIAGLRPDGSDRRND
jgi:RimJ/RimL family protein N-acetyltransferase